MKVFANKKMKQFIIILVTVIMLFNVIAPAPLVHQSHAASIGGVLMSPITALASGLSWAFQQVLNGVQYATTALTNWTIHDGSDQGDVFISDIVYNNLDIIDANVFNPNTENPLLTRPGAEDGGITGIVQQWYSITRLMAIAASLVILVYVAIKIMIASTGKDKAKYTELLKDWLLSLLLIFSMHYILAAILFVSDGLVNFFMGVVSANGAMEAFNYKVLQDEAFAFNDTSIIYALVWMAFMVYTLIFLVLYIKRLILICFFVVISPIIVLLSTINKLRGKGSGVLETWLKEFIANVAIQPIDALLFTIIGSSIFTCINLGQPILALAFVIAFLPMRNWVMKYFDQNPSENKMQDAAKFAANGANLATKGVNAISNVSRKPRFNTSNLASAIDGAANGGVVKDKTPKPSNVTSGDKTTDTSSKTNSTRPGWKGGFAELSPQDYQKAMDSMEGETSRKPIISMNDDNAEIKTAPNSMVSKSLNGNSSSNRRLPQMPKLLGVAGRAAKVGAIKGAGLYAGAISGGLNAAAGGGYSKGFSSANQATQMLTGRAIDGTVSKASDYIDSFNEGGLSGMWEQARSDVGSVITAGRDTVMDSYIVTGQEGIADEKIAMAEFFKNGEVDDMIHDLIEECGDGDPLYEQYMAASSVGAKREIAQQFFMQSAIRDYGADRFGDLVKRRKGSELKAMMSVMQRHKGALTGKEAKKKKDEVRQRSLNYNNNNNSNNP